MTHKPEHKTNPHYDALPWETKKRFDDAMKPGKPGKHRNKPKPHDQKVNE